MTPAPAPDPAPRISGMPPIPPPDDEMAIRVHRFSCLDLAVKLCQGRHLYVREVVEVAEAFSDYILNGQPIPTPNAPFFQSAPLTHPDPLTHQYAPDPDPQSAPPDASSLSVE
jgi:hypothetical protein